MRRRFDAFSTCGFRTFGIGRAIFYLSRSRFKRNRFDAFERIGNPFSRFRESFHEIGKLTEIGSEHP